MINHIEAALPKKASSPEEANPEEKALSDNAKINQTVSKIRSSMNWATKNGATSP